MAPRRSIQQLSAPLLGLEAARRAIQADSRLAVESARRMGKVLADEFIQTSNSEVAAAAFAVANCSADEIVAHVDHLIEALRQSAQEETGGTPVLIVEDDALTAAVLSDELRAHGYDVLIARTGADALRLISQRDVALVLLDLVLPDADGRNLFIQIREQKSTGGVPVIVLTSKADVLTHAECHALGVDGFMLKPIRRDVLPAVVAAHIDRARVTGGDGIVDALTGLPTRSVFEESYIRASKLAFRQRRPVALAIIDLDHFKRVNDSHGHAVGDEVLRTAAIVVKSSLRATDLVARYGGEEFCVLLPDTNLSGGRRALEKALENLRAEKFRSDTGAEFAVTFSAGVVEARPGEGGAQALDRADKLLYLAKAAGRNRVLSEMDQNDPPRPLVIIADDDEAVGQTVKATLERDGYAVTVCQDGASAFDTAQTSNPSALIVDVSMPVLDGYGLVEKVRSSDALSRVPIIMLTGADAEADIVRAFKIGVNDYVVKPFFTSELCARVKRLVSSR